MYKKALTVLTCLLFGLAGAFAQKKVSGLVTNAANEPMPGVSVILKNDAGVVSGVVTNVSGNYTIDVPSEDAVLEFSFIGYKTESLTVADRTVINLVLEEDHTMLDEVLVMGYGTQKRAHLTGAVSQISSADLVKAPMQNVSNMLTGKLPGLTSIQRTGNPGDDGTTLYIRGLNTFTSTTDNAPMIVVDGVARSMDNINSHDIETITVLKDAAAAIYGIQGANGVILITTKSGSRGEARITYDGSVSFVQNTAMPKFLNATDYMYWHNKAREMDGLTPLWTADIQNQVLTNDPNSVYGQTDWLDMIFRTGVTHQHNISASGGTDRTQYYASFGYMNQEGTLKNTDLNRFNVRINLDVEVAKNLKLFVGLAADRTERNRPGTAIGDQTEFNPIRQAINSIPVLKAEYQGLPVAWNEGVYAVNGYAALYESGYKQYRPMNIDTNYKLEYDFGGSADVLQGLKGSMYAAYNYSHSTTSDYDRYYELYYVNSTGQGITGASGYNPANGYTKSSSWGDTWLVRPQIDYAREFGKHFVGGNFFYEAKRSYSSTMTGSKRGYYVDSPVDLTLGTTEASTPITGSHRYYGGNASWVGRLNYAYDSKYLFEFMIRRDGSYVFAPENRWGSFPMVSAGWVISKEDFFARALPFVTYLKIRGTYGITGNENNVTPFLYNSSFSLANNSMVLGGASVAQYYTNNAYIYRDLKWSTTSNYNIGIDADLWNGLLGIEFDYFYKLTKDIMEAQSGNYPTSLGGYYPSLQNSGKVENWGFELTLKHDNRISGTDWRYSLSGNVSFSRNKVLSRVMTDNHPNYQPVVGTSMNVRYGFKALGLFQSWEEIDDYPAAPSGNLRPGDIKYKDYNGDGIISSTYDYVKIGYGVIPEINFSLNVDVSFRNFYLYMLWQGVTHVDYELSGVYDSGVISSTVYTSPFSGNTPYYLVTDAWTPDNPDAKWPRLTTSASGNNAWQSSFWIVNGEYLRLKQAQIGYQIPESLLKKTPFTQVNVYVAGTNLLTFSHFKYIDPESPSVSNGYYPQPRTFSCGVKLTF